MSETRTKEAHIISHAEDMPMMVDYGFPALSQCSVRIRDFECAPSQKENRSASLVSGFGDVLLLDLVRWNNAHPD